MFRFVKFRPPWWAPREKMWKFVTLDFWKTHLGTPEQLKMSLKNLSTVADILDKSHDVMQKLHKNRKQT